jgi:hypothetical protein
LGAHHSVGVCIKVDRFEPFFGIGHDGLEGVKRAFAELADPERHAKMTVDPWR